MVLERTSVGLDVHARSVVAGVLDVETGELWSERLPVATEAVLGWIGSLPGPVAVAYEAGPTGFGLARGLAAAGVRCVVVAPSKLERPPGDRVVADELGFLVGAVQGGGGGEPGAGRAREPA